MVFLNLCLITQFEAIDRKPFLQTQHHNGNDTPFFGRITFFMPTRLKTFGTLSLAEPKTSEPFLVGRVCASR